MKKYEDIKTAICPKCGQEYTADQHYQEQITKQ